MCVSPGLWLPFGWADPEREQMEVRAKDRQTKDRQKLEEKRADGNI